MAQILHLLGDTTKLLLTVTKRSDGTAQAVALTSTVKASVRQSYPDGTATLIAGPFTASSGATGASWSTGLVRVDIETARDAAITPGTYDLEVQITDVATDATSIIPAGKIRIEQDTIA